jgi:hypothetical protein
MRQSKIDSPISLTFFQFFHTLKRDSKVVIVFPSCRIVQKLNVSDVDD